MSKHVLEGEMLFGNNANENLLIPRMTLMSSDIKIPFKFQCRQFSLIVSYAMTINKRLGKSFLNVRIFLRKPIFSHGQCCSLQSEK